MHNHISKIISHLKCVQYHYKNDSTVSFSNNLRDPKSLITIEKLGTFYNTAN